MKCDPTSQGAGAINYITELKTHVKRKRCKSDMSKTAKYSVSEFLKCDLDL